jgi:hypothetical protein
MTSIDQLDDLRIRDIARLNLSPGDTLVVPVPDAQLTRWIRRRYYTNHAMRCLFGGCAPQGVGGNPLDGGTDAAGGSPRGVYGFPSLSAEGR